MRLAVGVLVALACVACKEEEHATVVSSPMIDHEVKAPHQVAPSHWDTANTAEDGLQLTPEEQARYDRMVEGTSEIPACNELVRQVRKLSACKAYPVRARTLLQRSALMIGEMAQRDNSPSLARACTDAAASFADTVHKLGC